MNISGCIKFKLIFSILDSVINLTSSYINDIDSINDCDYLIKKTKSLKSIFLKRRSIIRSSSDLITEDKDSGGTETLFNTRPVCALMSVCKSILTENNAYTEAHIEKLSSHNLNEINHLLRNNTLVHKKYSNKIKYNNCNTFFSLDKTLDRNITKRNLFNKTGKKSILNKVTSLLKRAGNFCTSLINPLSLRLNRMISDNSDLTEISSTSTSEKSQTRKYVLRPLTVRIEEAERKLNTANSKLDKSVETKARACVIKDKEAKVETAKKHLNKLKELEKKESTTPCEAKLNKRKTDKMEVKIDETLERDKKNDDDLRSTAAKRTRYDNRAEGDKNDLVITEYEVSMRTTHNNDAIELCASRAEPKATSQNTNATNETKRFKLKPASFIPITMNKNVMPNDESNIVLINEGLASKFEALGDKSKPVVETIKEFNAATMNDRKEFSNGRFEQITREIIAEKIKKEKFPGDRLESEINKRTSTILLAKFSPDQFKIKLQKMCANESSEKTNNGDYEMTGEVDASGGDEMDNDETATNEKKWRMMQLESQVMEIIKLVDEQIENGIVTPTTKMLNTSPTSKQVLLHRFKSIEPKVLNDFLNDMFNEQKYLPKPRQKLTLTNWANHAGYAVKNLAGFLNEHLKSKHKKLWVKIYNNALEEKYRSDEFGYELIIRGEGIKKFKTTREKLDEIIRCLKNVIIKEACPYDEDKAILIKTHNYSSYQVIKNSNKWPSDAFNNGVTIESMPTHIPIKIQKFDKQYSVSESTKLYEQLHDAGFSKATRIAHENHKGVLVEKTQIKGFARSLGHYVEMIKNGIEIEHEDGLIKTYTVESCFRMAMPCSNCGNLSHRSCRTDRAEMDKRCLKCSNKGHNTDLCRSSNMLCINCNGCHQTDNDLCPKLREKTYSDNRYILDILIGEKIIKCKDDIFGSKSENLLILDDVKNYIDNKVDSLRTVYDEQHAFFINEHKTLERRVNTNEHKIDNLNKKLDCALVDINKKIDGVSINLTKQIETVAIECKTSINSLGNQLSSSIASLSTKMDNSIEKNNDKLLAKFILALSVKNQEMSGSIISTSPPRSPASGDQANL